MTEEKEKAIEKAQLPPKVQPEAVEDELSEADLESVSGASLVECTCCDSRGTESA